MSKTESLVRVAAAYVIALAVASAWLIWGPDTPHLWLDALIADVLATLVIFAASRLMDRGLWGWSRHPNYFGEICFWFSLALFGLAASPDSWWWLFAGTVAMTAMFLGASIPMMEKRSLARRPAYQDVIDRVPRLVPRPPRAAG